MPASRPDTCKLVPNDATMSTPGVPVRSSASCLSRSAFAALTTYVLKCADAMTCATVPCAKNLAVDYVGDLVATLSLVYVMRRDEHGEAVCGERMDLVPEFPARL